MTRKKLFYQFEDVVFEDVFLRTFAPSPYIKKTNTESREQMFSTSHEHYKNCKLNVK